MNFLELKKSITKFSIESRDFLKMTSTLQEDLFKLSKKEFITILKEIGTIPEYSTRLNRREIVLKKLQIYCWQNLYKNLELELL